MADLATKRRSKLLAVEPDDVLPKKAKILEYGPPGVGKSWAAMDWPSAYYFDIEAGADLKPYRDKLKAAGGMYFGQDQGALDMEVVIAQVQALATEQHPYKTMVFDSITKLYNTALADEQERLGDKDAYGAYKKTPIRQMTRLLRWVNRADMNAIFICHETAEWGLNNKGEREQVGLTFDGWAKLAFELHLVLRISKIGTGANAKRFAHIGKSRLTGFPEGERFDWSYPEFAQRYGRDVIEKEVQPIVLASPEQVNEVRRLLEVVKMPDDWMEKCFKKAGVDDWSEMEESSLLKVTDALKAKLSSTNGDA